MQFIKNGPDIPERLLQAHEEGRVVFFCGAGVSYPARLPGFSGLVKKLYIGLGITPNAVQQAAIKAGQFDTAIGLLEREYVGGRVAVRRELARILTPDLTAKNATTTHEAILTLGKNRVGRTRLITTNFDRLFEEVIKVNRLTVDSFQAPLLPVPKNRWDGLVYLHGLLNDTPTENDLHRLVLSSGDFGLAYLSERWAARFISELFRNYVVCFVGYSINDPVLRYMMDALAADRQLGELPSEVFAFGSHSKGKEKAHENEWRAKNVTPILYREHSRHAYLHKTLHSWANTYRDGVQGKERIVVECAMARPLGSTKQDDFVGRLLWALSDEGGLPAKRFSELDPAPSIDWLEPLSDGRYRHRDLARFGVSPRTVIDKKLEFSLIRRPAPYSLAPFMALVDAGARGSRWDQVMQGIARWLLRHLDDPTLLLWLVKNGGPLNDELEWFIERRLIELAKLKAENKTGELARIRTSSPNAIPDTRMLTLWRLLLTGRVRSRPLSLDLYRWCDHFKSEGLTLAARLELRETLKPLVVLREPYHSLSGDLNKRNQGSIKELVEWKIVLSTEYVHSCLRDLPKDESWTAALPLLLADFNSLLRDVLDLMRELGGAEDRSDLSYIQQPSIAEHPQNKDFHDWTALIDLTRDAWLATATQSSENALLLAETWARTPYPLFRRLAFFAAAQEKIIPWRRGLDWLLADEHWWLWSVETKREAIRLLVVLAQQVDDAGLAQLEQAILVGPPRAMFRDNIEAESFARIVDREIWLRLAKIDQAGVKLGKISGEKFADLSVQNQHWLLATDQRDEFPFWMGDGNERRESLVTPRPRRELVEWLKQHPSSDHWQEDDWQQRCRDNFATSACALYALARVGDWPTDRWREALQAWSEEKLMVQSWRCIGPVLLDAPDAVLQTHAVSWWLKSIAKTFDGHEPMFFALVSRILSLDYEDDAISDGPITRAINHPVGHVTEALLNWWYRESLEDGQGLPTELRSYFTALCDTATIKYRHGRVLLAAHVVALFRVDPEWTTEHLLPLFDWQSSALEALSVWEGFLWSPRPYPPLLRKIKQAFLDTSYHYTELGNHGRQYAAILTYAALDQGDTFLTTELALSTRSLPPEGLHVAAQALVRAIEGSGEQCANYWKNRIVPYLHSIWPKNRDDMSQSIAESLGRLCIAAQEAFPEALGMTRDWLQPPMHPDFLIHLLHEANICSRFPEPALDFLDLVLGDQIPWLPSDLESCLKAIVTSRPALASDTRFTRLIEYHRQQGGEL